MQRSGKQDEEKKKLDAEERYMNHIMFWEMIIIPIVAWIFVMVFLDGTARDAIAFLMVIADLIVRIFEDKIGIYAKYLYTSIMPFFGSLVIVFTNDGKFAAVAVCYIWVIIVCIAGYDISVLKVNIIVTVVSNLVCMLYRPEAYLKIHPSIVWIFILMMYMIAMINALDAYRRLHRRERIRQRMKVYEHQMEVMKQTEKKVRGLRHDMKHHVQELGILAEQKRYDDIIEYLQMMGRSMENAKEYVSSGNKEINAICNFMLEKATAAGLDVDADVNFPDNISVPYFEISSIIGNLLENATEAAIKCREPRLTFHMNYKKGILYIRVTNPYNGVIRKKGEYYLSTKEEENHGYGLRNIQDFVQGDKGSIKIQHDDQYFQVDVLLYVSSFTDSGREKW